MTGLEISVIGMCGRFPGAKNLEEYWENLKNGVESIWFASDRELQKLGVSSALLENPGYVKTRGGILEDKEWFDAVFFDYNPREAELMDPQIRVFHECSWEALENAGYNPDTYKGTIGIYAGATFDLDWHARAVLSGKSEALGYFESGQLTNKDFLCTRVAYRLNLKGPAVLVQTACSTSLVAIHMACRALLTGECDIALAGGVTIFTQAKIGYLYQEGMVNSPDGHCRAFDARAGGMIGGEGVGVVVLKKLKNAAADNDHIRAVILGSAVNNDGKRKVGFTAPSIDAQASLVKMLYHIAGVEPESIDYIETHGTGTPLGDPIEIEALKQAFNTNKRGFCRIGSVKTNIGHLDSAAGVAGFIKTVLALEHRLIPPTLHYTTTNSKIDFENSPFRVNAELFPWKNDAYPLRAAVSSLGMGGTNAHVVLEEAPGTGDRRQSQGRGEVSSPHQPRDYQLILLSAKTPTALDKMTENLVEYLKENLLNRGNLENPTHPGPILANTAYTLQTSRTRFNHRRRLVCSTIEEAVEAFSSPASRKVYSYYANDNEKKYIVFMFSGQGTQYANMGLELYQKQPGFRQEIDRCLNLLPVNISAGIKNCLFPGSQVEEANARITAQDISQPLSFIFSYALAQLLINWGIQPHVMTGSSIGEYVAACLAGVFSLEDALELVVLRGQLMQKLPPGVMLSVPLPEQDLKPLLNDELSLAVVNGPSCIVSGTRAAIETFEEQLKEKKYFCLRLNISHAGHSPMMDSMSGEFAAKVKAIRLKPPQIPIISAVTGKWLKNEEAVSPEYWKQHLRQPVRFAAGIDLLTKKNNYIYIEVGPGRDLSAVVLRQSQKNTEPPVINLIRHQQNDVSDIYYLLGKIGDLWFYGVDIDWKRFYAGTKRTRIPLPPYPFERKRYWLDVSPGAAATGGFPAELSPAKTSNIDEWFYIPSWKRLRPLSRKNQSPLDDLPCLVFSHENRLAQLLVKRLQENRQTVILVKTGLAFHKENNHQYLLNPRDDKPYNTLFHHLRQNGNIPGKILHLWGITEPAPHDLDLPGVESAQDLGFYSLLNMARAIAGCGITSDIRVQVVTNNMQDAAGENELHPEKSTLIGAVKAISQEYANIKCRSVDILLPAPGSEEEQWLIDNLIMELANPGEEPEIAYRQDHRWAKIFEPIPLAKLSGEPSRLREGGVYLVTGGLGGIGFALAEFLAQKARASLILVGRTPLPPRDQWNQYLENQGEDDRVPAIIRKIRQLEALNTGVIVLAVDVSHRQPMEEAIAAAEKKLGKITGVIHSAGIPDGALIQRRTRAMTDNIMAPKVQGTVIIDSILRHHYLDFFILCSSLASVLPGYGQAGYSAANTFLDHFARYRVRKTGQYTCSINWERWRNIGMSVALEKKHQERTGEELVLGMTGKQGVEVFVRILEEGLPQCAVSMSDLNHQLRQLTAAGAPAPETVAALIGEESQHLRPRLSSPYAPPGNDTEKIVAEIWQKSLGFQPIGVKDDFFELKGDSLKAIGILSKIQKKMNVSIPLNEFFERPTVEKLSRYIQQQPGTDTPAPDHQKQKTRTFAANQSTEKKEYYPLAATQKRVYILHHQDPTGTEYNATITITLSGEPAKEKLENIFKKLIHRHESLRTSFVQVRGEVVQRIHEMENIAFTLSYYERDKGEGKNLVKIFKKPFNLEQPPLLRTGMIKISPQKNLLIVDIHHIVVDDISLSCFLGELMASYRGKELPHLKLQYKDYSEWQNRIQQQEMLKRQESYWLKEFEIPPLSLQLPYDFEPSGPPSLEGSTINFIIREELTHGLKDLAQKEETTLFMILLAVINVFFYKLTQQEDIVIATPIMNRCHEDLMSVIGIFANTIVLRNYPKGEKTFSTFLKELRKRTIQAFENQEYPFNNLVEKLKIKRTPGRNPLFDVMFQLPNLEIPGMQRPDIQSDIQLGSDYGIEKNTAKLDLLIIAVENQKEIHFNMNYKTRRFKKEKIKQFIQHIKTITAAVVKNPGIQLSGIQIVAEDKKRKTLSNFLEDLEKE